MKFASFFRQLQEELLKQLPANTDIEISEAYGPAKRMIIRTPADIICPSISLDPFYRYYLDGHSLSGIMNRILKIYGAETLHPLCTPEDFPDKTDFLGGLRLRPASLSLNRRILQTLPHITRYNILFFMTVKTAEKYGIAAESPVTDELLRHFRTDLSAAFLTAQKNIAEEDDPLVLPLHAFLEMTAESCSYDSLLPSQSFRTASIEDLYVLTNRSHEYGAVLLLEKAVLGELYARFGAYYLLPASVHELLILPKTNAGNELRLRSLIHSVNNTISDSLTVLSDDLYAYDPVRGIYIC